MSVRLQKRLWLCNTFAIGGTVIMAGWAALEALFGDSAALPWEIGFTTGFLGVLALNARGAHRAARLLLVVSANLCVFAGAILFSDSAGGTLPFFAMAAIPLLLFGPGEWLLAALGAALPVLLFARVQSGVAAHLLVINPQPGAGVVLRRRTPRRRSRWRSWSRFSCSGRTSGPRRRWSAAGRRS